MSESLPRDSRSAHTLHLQSRCCIHTQDREQVDAEDLRKGLQFRGIALDLLGKRTSGREQAHDHATLMLGPCYPERLAKARQNEIRLCSVAEGHSVLLRVTIT